MKQRLEHPWGKGPQKGLEDPTKEGAGIGVQGVRPGNRLGFAKPKTPSHLRGQVNGRIIERKPKTQTSGGKRKNRWNIG